MVVWYGLRSFGIFFPFGYVCLEQEKSGNHGQGTLEEACCKKEVFSAMYAINFLQ
jgi:hypothetical protein